MHSPPKLQRTFVRDEAYHILRNWIVEGKLAPGCTLKDKDLAEQFGVSRTPIREALLRLENEGLVQSKPNCSTQVSPIDVHRAQQLYLLVGALECLALECAFEHICAEHISLMQMANQQLQEKLCENDPLGAVAADNEFHAVFIRLCQNEELVNILATLKFKIKRLEIYYFDAVHDVELSCLEHLHLIEAIQRKNKTEAVKAVELNWKASFARLRGCQPQQILE